MFKYTENHNFNKLYFKNGFSKLEHGIYYFVYTEIFISHNMIDLYQLLQFWNHHSLQWRRTHVTQSLTIWLECFGWVAR